MINTLPFEAENSLGTVLKLHPALRPNPMSPAMTIAEILASVHVHNTAGQMGDPMISNVLLPYNALEHLPFLTKMGGWIRDFGIIVGIGITALLLFRFCGIGSLITQFVPCLSFLKYCSPYTWLAISKDESEKPEPSRQTVPQESKPLTCRIELTPIKPPAPSVPTNTEMPVRMSREPYTAVELTRNKQLQEQSTRNKQIASALMFSIFFNFAHELKK